EHVERRRSHEKNGRTFVLQADDGIRAFHVTGVQTCALPIWPIDPDPAVAPPEAVLFVDGVRRVDAQVWVEDGGAEATPALCASYAAGVVCCCRERGAHLVTADVRRGLFTTAESAEDVRTTAGTYRATRTAAHPDVAPAQLLSLAVQRE